MRLLIFIFLFALTAFSQVPAIEPGVSHSLAIWRAAHYSDVRYKLNLTLEKMSPVLKGTIEIRVNVSEPPASAGGQHGGLDSTPIILDWRRLIGHEKDSTISNVSLNGKPVSISTNWPPPDAGGSDFNEHLIFRDGVVVGENVIKLDFTSPILTSGSAITRYIDKEDGSEYIYSLFVPSDASTAFPVFDQPDLKARFSLLVRYPGDWRVVCNTPLADGKTSHLEDFFHPENSRDTNLDTFSETKPISTYVFAFAAGPWEKVSASSSKAVKAELREAYKNAKPFSELMTAEQLKVFKQQSPDNLATTIYVRKSQAGKFQQHAAETFRLTREAIKYLETYFDYKFPWPKYDLVLIPEFPFGGMEHAGATFLRESSVIFPSEPTKGDYISRATLIFHETAHQWFGDTVTMVWFDDLWLKEGFAEFMAYKTLEKVMPDANAWKVFYERNKQAAYATDSTSGTTPIYQPIANLSAAKSAYGNIVYRKAPSFLRQAEFYLGEDKFQTAVRAFLKKHEFGNAGWEDLVNEFEIVKGEKLQEWASRWIMQKGVPLIHAEVWNSGGCLTQTGTLNQEDSWGMTVKVVVDTGSEYLVKDHWERYLHPIDVVLTPSIPNRPIRTPVDWILAGKNTVCVDISDTGLSKFIFPNYQDYGYGIFLLDDTSRDYVLKNIQNEKDDFLRTMMWGSLWDSVREAELDPKDYVELVVKNLATEPDEGTVQTLLARVSTAMNYYINDPASGGNASVNERASTRNGTLVNTRVSTQGDLRTRLEARLIDRLQHAETPGQRITFYRSFVANATTEKSRTVLKEMLRQGGNASVNERANMTSAQAKDTLPAARVSASIPLRTKDRFDIVTRLIILGDPDAPKLLDDLIKTETGDDAKRYAYAAHAAFGTAGNKAKYWNDFLTNKDISESWIEAAMVPFNSIRHADLTQPYLTRALAELPNLKRSRKIFFVNGWLGAFIGGQRSETALAIVNKFLADNPNLDKDLRLKILENVDLIERAVKIRKKFARE